MPSRTAHTAFPTRTDTFLTDIMHKHRRATDAIVLALLAAALVCTGAHAAIFWAYCAVDFWCYYFGLWVLQRGGASLQVLSSSIALPMQQLFLCARPLVGRWAEDFFWGDGLALVLVLHGFGVYQGMSPEGRASRRGALP